MPYPYRSFRQWFDDEERRGGVVRIKAPIKCGDESCLVDIGNGIPGRQPQTEVRALSRYLLSLPGKPLGFIEHPVNNRPDIPVVLNPWPTRERVLRGMGASSKDALCRKILDLPARRVKPRKVSRSEAPCKDVLVPAERVDLRRDIARVWVEFHQCLWSTFNATAVIHDPETGAHSLGKIRLGQYQWHDADPQRPFPAERLKKYMYAALSRGGPRPANTAGRYLQHRRQNRPLPAAFTLGDPTDVHVLAAVKTLPWPQSGDEYEMLGGLRGEPVEITAAETIPGLFVPARSQWVIEGEFLPEDETLPAFAGDDNFIPYIIGGGTYTVFRVSCITRRKDAWWTASLTSTSGLHGQNGTHTALAQLNLEVEALNYLRGRGFQVQDVALPAGHLMAVIQLCVDGARKPCAHYGRTVGEALSSCGVHAASSYIIVVGPDTDPHCAQDVLLALALLTRPMADATAAATEVPAIDTMLGNLPEGHKPPRGGEQVIIDATIPVPERFAGWRPRSDPPDWERAALETIRKKLESRD